MFNVFRFIRNVKSKLLLQFSVIENFLSTRNIMLYEDLSLEPKNVGFKKYFKSHSCFINDGYSCLIIECRLCSLQNERNLAYVIKKTGLFLCPKCNEMRNSCDIVHHYKQAQLLPKKKTEWPQYKSMHSNLEPITKEVCDKLKISGLNAGDLNLIGSLYNAELNLLHFPLRNAINLIVGEKIFNVTNQTEHTSQKTIKSGLLIFGAEKTKAVIVSNIKDFLVTVAQNLENHAVVCLPYFLINLPQECLPGLERFTELVFWFDFDSAGWDAARTISQKLNENRCLLIRPTAREPSPYVAYKRGLDFRKILVNARPVLHKSITTFETLKQDVLSELQNIEKANGVKWKRFPVLSKLLKGHRKGELTIITGPTGSGKTTFMSEYSLDLALQGVSTLWGSFEIRNSRLAATLLRQFVGYSLEKHLNEFDHWATEFEKYPLYFMTFHGQQSIQVVMETIEHARYVFDINHVIIDNLQFMMGISGNYKKDKFWEQDEIISSFRSFATQKNVHVTLVVHPRKERNEEDLTTSSVFGSAKATQEADNVLIIQDKRLVSLKGKKYLQIAKNRFCGDLGVMPLEFNKEALSYSNCPKKKMQ